LPENPVLDIISVIFSEVTIEFIHIQVDMNVFDVNSKILQNALFDFNQTDCIM